MAVQDTHSDGPRAVPHGTLHGTPVVPGVAYAPVVVATVQVPASAIAAFGHRVFTDDAAVLAEFDAAVTAVADRLTARASATSGSAADVLSATAGLARDTGLRTSVAKRLDGGDYLLDAVEGAIDEFAELFTGMGGLMAERVTDLRDIERRLTAEIVGAPEPGVPAPAQPSVLVAEDLAPSDTAGLQPGTIAALVTERGGPTSHTAIIARQLGIPCVVAVPGVLTIAPGTPVLVDGTTGEVVIWPAEETAAERVEESAADRSALAAWTGPAATRDGHPVKLLANIQDAASARAAASGPVDGVGLFRTELSFLGRTDEPSVEEQIAVYAEVLAAFGPDRTVIVRTLDAGSDKPMAFTSRPGEENPALGVRGLRLSFDDPGLLDRQLEAISAAATQTGTSPWVMAPMVATVAEARDFTAKVHPLGLRAGIMVEIPSAALQARQILEHVDFLSIGTNDLTQYTMAADRMASGLAHLTDPWQPAVLGLIAITAEAGRQAGKPVGVCGEAAADPALATALIGMGITSLSMAPAAVAAVGVRLGGVDLETCEAAAAAALAQVEPTAARDVVRTVLAR